MGLLGRTQLLAKAELKSEKVVLDEEKDEYVFVRQMTGHEKSVWEMSQMKQSGTGKNTKYDFTLDDYKAKLAVVCVCDENGELLFKEKDYLELSKNISAAKLEKIVDAAQRLNIITEEDREELTKN